MIKIYNYLDIEENNLELLHSVDNRSIFITSDWLKLVSQTYGFPIRVSVYFDEFSKNIKAILLYMVDYPYGDNKRLVSLPFSDYSNCYYRYKEDMCFLIQETGNIENAPIILKFAQDNIEVFNSDFVIKREALLHELDLKVSLENLWNNLDQKFRNQVRKAQKSSVTTVISQDKEDLECFWKMHAYLRKNKFTEFPQPFIFFQNLWDIFINHDKGFLVNAYKDNKIIASTIFLIDDGTAYYKFNTSIPEYLKYCPNNLIIWNAVEYLKTKRITKIDFGLTGTSESYKGLKNFKDGTGAEVSEIKVGLFNSGKDKSLDLNLKNEIISYSKELIKLEISLEQIDLFSKYFYKFFA